MPYQSLYRRYRPQRFEQVVGQDHVTRALRNAVRDGRTAHAYLFSGPRGTGKTSTARILAKALNCTNLADGEPCGVCDSCVQVAAGTSLDVMELDAASNNGVDAMRDLISRAALGTPGRSKVYIVDEVHMLSAAASNTLLKTLEEPPAHVVFVLATTEPQKVLPTIRSRTQHFEFRLLPPDLLAEHLRWVVGDAGLEVAPDAITLVARRGNGSARDALSALDQVAAAGGIDEEAAPVDEVVEALCDQDASRVLVATAEACGRGHDPRQLAREIIDQLRSAFLTLMARHLVTLSDDDAARLEDQARRLGAAAVVRAIEVLGDALIEMRDTVDPRVVLEVALVRLSRPDLDTSPAALTERIERLERQLAGGAAPLPPGSPPPAAAKPAAGGRAALGAFKQSRSAPSAPPDPDPPPPAAATSDVPTRDDLQLRWADQVLPRLSARARARLQVGRWLAADGGAAVLGLPSTVHRERCEELVGDVEAALAAEFGRPVPVRLAVDDGGPPPATPSAAAPPPEPDDEVDLTELTDAPAAVPSGIDHLKQAFPGAQLVEE